MTELEKKKLEAFEIIKGEVTFRFETQEWGDCALYYLHLSSHKKSITIEIYEKSEFDSLKEVLL